MADPKTYDLAEVLEDGRPRYRKLANGSIFDNLVRHIVAGAQMTSEQARELQGRRVEVGRQAALEGMTRGMGLPLEKAGSGEEWKAVVEAFTAQFKGSKNLRGMAESFEKLGRATGYLAPPGEDRTVLQAVVGSVLTLFDRLEKRDVIDGEVTDAH